MKADGVLLAAVLLSATTGKSALVKSDDCDCYHINGPDAGYFQRRLFYDFRNVPNDGENNYTIAPDIVPDFEAQGEEPATSAYLDSTDWKDNWTYLNGPTDSGNNPYPFVYSRQNVYISRNTTEGSGSSTYLTMRAARKEDFVSASQIISTQQDVMYASIRARMRVIPNGLSDTSAPIAGVQALNNSGTGSNASHPVDSGAVVGLFLYKSETQETDIEILTHDGTTQIRYSNQPDYDNVAGLAVQGASTQATLPGGLEYTQWIDHRLDWFDGVVRWWANDILVLNKSVNTPTEPMALNLNVWSNGDENWSGTMNLGSEVTVGIEWIEMVYNTSSDSKSGSSMNRGAPCSLLMMATAILAELTLVGMVALPV